MKTIEPLAAAEYSVLIRPTPVGRAVQPLTVPLIVSTMNPRQPEPELGETSWNDPSSPSADGETASTSAPSRATTKKRNPFSRADSRHARRRFQAAFQRSNRAA